MKQLMKSCPVDCHKQFNALCSAVADEHKGGFAAVIEKATAAGVPWGALIGYLTTHAATIAGMFTGGFSVDAVVGLIVDALKIVPIAA